MTQFADLPDEVVQLIAQEIPSGEHFGLLCSNKRFYEISLPFQYSDAAESCQSHGRLALALLKNKRLPPLVRSAYMQECYTDDLDEIAIRRDFVRLIRETPGYDLTVPGEADYLADEEIDPLSDANDFHFGCRYVELICTRCNIKDLKTTCGYMDFDLCQALYDTYAPHLLPSLTSLELEHWDTEYGFDLGKILPLFASCSHLESLSCNMCVGLFWDGETSHFDKAPLSSVRILNFDYSALDNRELKDVVKFFPNITEFAFHAGSSTVTQAKDEMASAAEISDAIMGWRNTLEKFTLDQSDRDFIGLDEHEEAAIGSLSGLGKLKVLNLEQRDLYNVEEESDEEWVDKLPSSLRVLQIMSATEAIEPGLRKLVRVLDDRFPFLEKVILPGYHSQQSIEGLEKVIHEL